MNGLETKTLALLTRVSTCPKRSIAWLMIWSAVACSEMSPSTVRTSGSFEGSRWLPSPRRRWLGTRRERVLTGQYPQPLEVSLASQLVCGCGLARLGAFNGLAGRAIGDRDREGGQELGACLAWPGARAWVVGVRCERGHVIVAPYLQRHRGQALLELVGVGGGEQAESAPFAGCRQSLGGSRTGCAIPRMWSPAQTPTGDRASAREVLRALGGKLAVQQAGELADFDEISVRVPHVAADLGLAVDGRRDELGALLHPRLVTGPDISDPQIQENRGRVTRLVVDHRDAWLVGSGRPARVHEYPRIGQPDD